LGIDVSDAMLNQALTHSSCVDENNNSIENNERMEFLGDTVLDTIISTYLYTNHPGLKEGELSSIRSAIVNRYTLEEVCNELNLLRYLNIAVGQRTNVNIAGDTVEAVIAAVFLQGGLVGATAFVHKHFETQIQAKLSGGFIDENYKGKLQEVLSSSKAQEILFQGQAKNGAANSNAYRPKYATKEAEESANAHTPTFVTQVMVDKECLGAGKGSSKKAAEKEAAQMAYGAIMKRIRDHKM